MRLLFVSERYPPDPGGVAASAGRISATLARTGHAVGVLAFSHREAPGRAGSSDADHGLTVHRFGPFDDIALTLEQAERLARLLHRRHRFEAVWGHALGTAGFLATVFARRAGVPLLLSARGDDFDRLFYPPGDFARLEWCLRSAAAVSAVSAELAGRVGAVTGRPATVLPNAVDGRIFCPGPRPAGLALRHGLREGDVVLGFSGELRAGKGMAPLLDAFARARAARPACKLLLLGDVHPDDRPEFQRVLAKTPGLGSAVVRTGHVPEPAMVARFLRLCDVLLLPSLREGLPNSLLEALASGVPVVAASVGGVPEVMADGRGGLLVPRTHLHLFGQRVLEVLAWPAERRRAVAEAGRAVVLERYTLASESERLEALLAGITPARGGTP
jgi:glycosyltransferase involved in cell wall biosynthesis